MPRMRSVDAAVAILEREGVDTAFGVPGAAINPFYSAMRAHGGIRHILARHVEGASHMAEGYTRAAAGNIGVCVGTSGRAGTDMITGLYSAGADSIPILAITGQAPVARLHKEDFQAVDIASIAAPLCKLATTVLEPAQVPGAFQLAFHLMRSGRPGPVLLDLPFDVQLAEIDFDPDTYEPMPVDKPRATRAQAAKALDLLERSERPLIVAGGGVVNADAAELLVELAELLGVPVVPTLMGWGTIPDDHPLMVGMVGLQTSHRYGNATMLAADFVLGIGNRWANRHTGGLDVYRSGRTFVHVDIEPTQIGAGVPAGLRHRLRRRRRVGGPDRGGPGAAGGRPAGGPLGLGTAVPGPQAHHAAPDPLRRHADQAATGVRGDEQGVRPGDPLRQHDRALADRGRTVPARLRPPALDQRGAGRTARLDGAGGARGLRRGP